MSEILDLIQKRWSPRAFDSKPVSREKLQVIFEAARLSPSSNNEQPWSFIVGIKGEGAGWEKIHKAVNEWNQKWTIHAPVLVVVLARKTTEKSGRPNTLALYDAGQSVAYLTVQAMKENMYVHQMAGIYPAVIAQEFGVPEEYQVATIFALGYLGNPSILSEEHQKIEQPKGRKGLSEIVFTEWQKPFDF